MRRVHPAAASCDRCCERAHGCDAARSSIAAQKATAGSRRAVLPSPPDTPSAIKVRQRGSGSDPRAAMESCLKSLRLEQSGNGHRYAGAEVASTVSGRDHRHRHCCLCEPGSSRGRIPGGRREARTARSLADRNRNRSQVYPAPEPNGTRSRHHPDRSFLPSGKACSASGSSSRALERTPDQQR